MNVRVGGLFLHESCRFDLTGKGITASPRLTKTKRLWFEGPILPLPESQQQEDDPADMLGSVTIAKDAPLGGCRGRVVTSQGAAGGLVFVIGELPEVIEKEIDGEPIPEVVKLPITANGRMFPRDDVDLWEFDVTAGHTVTAFVQAESLHSPLEPKLEILDAAGKVLAFTLPHPVAESDASVRFTAPAAGKYRVRITDARSLGGPQYIYRLTITTANVPDVVFPLKVAPDGLKDVVDKSGTVLAPIALNGRVSKHGIADEWKVDLKKAGKYTLDLQARRAGSPLCGVIAVLDADGKELNRSSSDAIADPTLSFQPPADGIYTIRITERFRGRGGENFVYRLRITDGSSATSPGFKLTIAGDNKQAGSPDVLTVLRGATVKVKVNVERAGGFTGPIEVNAINLPKGVTMKPATIAANQTTGEITLTADATAEVGATPLTIGGTAGIGSPLSAMVGVPASVRDQRMSVTAVIPASRNFPEETSVLLAVAIPTPFKIIDQYVMTQAPRGEIYRRKYKIDRGGFDGPITVTLADKQARHLQGVTGPVVVVPPGQTEFEYPAILPSWMEMGRTCRVCVMATGIVKDADGKEHAVSFSSVEQNQQMIVVVGPGRLDVSLGKNSIRAAGEVRVPVTVSRGNDVKGDVKVEAMIPEHWKGVTVSPLTIPANATTGELVLKFTPDAGPFNLPLTIKATASGGTSPVNAEAKLDVVK